MKQLAKNVKVTANGKPLAGLTDCSLNLTTAFASSQTKEDPTPVDEPLRGDWEISVTGDFGREGDASVDAAALKAAIKVGTKMPVVFEIGTLASYQGTALLSSYSESAPTDGKITYQASFKGVSKLTKKA